MAACPLREAPFSAECLPFEWVPSRGSPASRSALRNLVADFSSDPALTPHGPGQLDPGPRDDKLAAHRTFLPLDYVNHDSPIEGGE